MSSRDRKRSSSRSSRARPASARPGPSRPARKTSARRGAARGGSGARRGRPEAVDATGAPLPRCRHFGTCGGCSLLDVAIHEQVRRKVERVEALLAPFLDGLPLGYEAPVATPVHYRTKLLYPVGADAQGLAITGIYQRLSHEIVRVRECRTQDEGLTALGVAAEAILRELRLEPWNETTGLGFVRAFGARLAAGTGELLMGIVTRPGVFAQGRDLADRLMAAARDLPQSGRRPVTPVGVVRSISDRDGNFLLGDRNVPLVGRDHQIDRQDGLSFRLRFGSFYQVHREAPSLLFAPALRLCGDVRGERVVDGYGGVGTFGLRLAKAGAARVEIVESNPVACGDAEHNATANRLGDRVVVEPAPFAAAAFAAEPDLLVVDPPRSGLQDDGVARVVAARPGRLLCVHCSAESLARDLDGLRAAGYTPTAVRLCDLFPHTDHVEMLTLLRRR